MWLAAKPVNPQLLLIALHHLVPLSREMRAALEPKKNPRNAWVVRLMVRLERFELPAFWFVARRSIQLSYSRMKGRAF